jgi:hypothetical protein
VVAIGGSVCRTSWFKRLDFLVAGRDLVYAGGDPVMEFLEMEVVFFGLVHTRFEVPITGFDHAGHWFLCRGIWTKLMAHTFGLVPDVQNTQICVLEIVDVFRLGYETRIGYLVQDPTVVQVNNQSIQFNPFRRPLLVAISQECDENCESGAENRHQ